MPAKNKAQLAEMAAWLRGFADGEGTVAGHTRGSRGIHITNTELVLLETAQMYLARLGIKSRIGMRPPVPSKPHWKQAWELSVQGDANLRNWRDLIGFTSPVKQERLARALALVKRRLPQQDIVDAYCSGMSTLQIAKRYNCTHGAIEYLLKKRGVRARGYSQAAVLQWRRQHESRKIG